MKAWGMFCFLENKKREVGVVPEQEQNILMRTRYIFLLLFLLMWRKPIQSLYFSICQLRLKRGRTITGNFPSWCLKVNKLFFTLIKGKSFPYMINPLYSKSYWVKFFLRQGEKKIKGATVSLNLFLTTLPLPVCKSSHTSWPT